MYRSRLFLYNNFVVNIMPIKNYTIKEPAMKSVSKVQEALISHGAVGIQTMYDPDKRISASSSRSHSKMGETSHMHFPAHGGASSRCYGIRMCAGRMTTRMPTGSPRPISAIGSLHRWRSTRPKWSIYRRFSCCLQWGMEGRRSMSMCRRIQGFYWGIAVETHDTLGSME